MAFTSFLKRDFLGKELIIKPSATLLQHLKDMKICCSSQPKQLQYYFYCFSNVTAAYSFLQISKNWQAAAQGADSLN